MPSDSTLGVAASVITMPRPCWPPIAPLATVILPACLTQVTEFTSRPSRSLPSTLTWVFPPVLTPAVAVAAPLSFEHPTSTAAPAASAIAPATTRFIVLIPSFVRRHDGGVEQKSKRASALPIPNFVGCRRYGSQAMRSFTGAERRARLAQRHFLAASASSIDDAVAAFVGLHATDPATPYLSLWARRPGFSVADLDAALYQRRTLVKHLAMRRTLWVVGIGDLPLIQAAASDRVAGNERRKLVADVQKASVADDGDGWLDRACDAVLAHLSDHGPATARQLREALPELAGTFDPAPGKRWGGDTPLSPRVLTVLSVRGDIVRGPNDGTCAMVSRSCSTTMRVLPSSFSRSRVSINRRLSR